MKKDNILNIQNFVIILIITFISIFYSSPFFSDLSTDMGAYYLGASLINENFLRISTGKHKKRLTSTF